MRVGIKGKRYSRSTRTTDREKAEKFLERFLSPLGLGSRRLPLADVWLEYVHFFCLSITFLPSRIAILGRIW